MSFTIALSTAVLMLVYAIPGYVLTKTGKLKAENIQNFAVLLMYACSPFQTVYAMQQIERTGEHTIHLAMMFGISLFAMGGMLGAAFLVLRKKQSETKFRILTVATAFGNCGFMGIPLIEAMLPEYPDAVAYAAAMFVAMNLLVWTLGSAVITHDARYISLKKVFLNPCTVAMMISLAFYFTGIRLSGIPYDFVYAMNKFCTPLCMLILGMRLGAKKLLPIFTDPLQYAAVAVKLFVYPLLVLCVCRLLPLEDNFVRGIYILSCVPVGNMVLSFAEMLGEGQEYAANVVLLSTMLSVLTMPLMLLLI